MITVKPLLLKSCVLLGAGIVLVLSCGKQISSVSETDPWKKIDIIIKSMPETHFLDKDYKVTDFGAVADGKTMNTAAFEKAIKACSENGGGKVIVPNGRYLTGAIHLESNVNLHLEDKAEILFSINPKDYPIVHTSWEGTEVMNYSPLIYAKNKTNVAITGKGTLNGQANNTNWWVWSGGKSYGWQKVFLHKMIQTTERFWLRWQKKGCQFQRESLEMEGICDQVLLNSLNVIRF